VAPPPAFFICVGFSGEKKNKKTKTEGKKKRLHLNFRTRRTSTTEILSKRAKEGERNQPTNDLEKNWSCC
jgi:hypothetical protein